MPKLIPRQAQDGEITGYSFYCPACKTLHSFKTVGGPPVWWFDGNVESPTFSPSLRYVDSGCHLFVQQGQIIYCNDCPHEFRNKTVSLVEWDTKRWCPVKALTTVNGKPVEAKEPGNKKSSAKKQVHHERCGDVGETGDHGDLGSNAKD